ncbi:MAG: META domain-containing protein [Pseudomonadota bacterium]
MLCHRVLAAVVAIGAACSSPDTLRATASGPDVFRVTGGGGALALHIAPDAASDVVIEIPDHTDGLVNLGCIGGLSFAEWTEASEDERAEGAATRWCLVGFARRLGWAPGPRLAEGAGDDGLDAGGRLTSLAGSEWRPVAGEGPAAEVEQFLRFESDDRFAGTGGCNRFSGTYTRDRETLTFGPAAMTRMACPEAAMSAERRVSDLMAATRRGIAHHLLLVLMDGEGRILAHMQRSDPE